MATHIIYFALFSIIFATLGVAHQGGSPRHVDRATLKAAKDREYANLATNPDMYDGRFDFQERSLFQMIMRQDEEVVRLLETGLRPLYAQMGDGEVHLNNLLRAIGGTTVEAEEDEPTVVCQGCQLAIGALKALAGLFEWEQIRAPLNAICVLLGPIVVPGLKSRTLCPGVLDAQGPVVYDMLRSANTLQVHCEYLNACFPPREDQKSADMYTLPSGPAQSEPKANNRNIEDALKILMISDIHLEPEYAEGSETDCGLPVCCLEQWGEGTAGKYGDYACNIPEATVDLFLDKIREMDPDYVIYGGDSPPHTIWLETEESQFDCTRQVVAAMKRGIPGMRVFPNIGNHEMYPTNIYYMEKSYTQNANEMFIAEWSSLAQFTQDDINSMRQSAYYSTRVAPGLVVVSWNTNYMHSMNWYNVISGTKQFGTNYIRNMEAFVEQKMEEALSNGDKVIMVGHHPAGGGDSIIINSRWVNEVVAKYKDIIVLSVSGHTHIGEFRMFHDPNTGEPTGVQHVLSSISAGNYKNPAIRLFYLDKDTFELLDYENHHLDIDEIVDGEEPEIEFSFMATEEYGLSDMSAQSWWDLIGRMNDDHELFMTYNYNRQTRTVRGLSCSGTCKINTLCRAAHTNFDDYTYCVSNAQPTEPPTTTTTTTTTTTASPPVDAAGHVGANVMMVAMLLLVSSLKLW